ncbi:4'-phosphopantetheinyl transferase superfamily protein, partial [Streptomyces sp. NPDC001635]
KSYFVIQFDQPIKAYGTWVGTSTDRFFYLSSVQMENGSYGAQFGEDGGYYRPGISVSRYPNNLITWVMISKDHPVGIDIELIKHKIKSIKHKFLSDLELAQKQIGDNTDGLYVAWCAIEANYKWHGKKGLEFKQHIHIKPFKLKNEGSLNALVELPSGMRELTINYFKTKDGYMLGYVAGNS